MESLFARIIPLTYTGPQSEGFTYELPQALELGQLVEVPLGKRQSLGIIVEHTPKPEFKTKPITRALDYPPLPPHLVKLAEWMSTYYFASAKGVWQTMLPSGLTTKRRAVKPSTKLTRSRQDDPLTKEQTAALAIIDANPHAPYLLQGVTGSGKTRIYIELATRALEQGKSSIILVPEIALTPQQVATFEAHFPGRIIVTHSHMTESQRHHAWVQALTATEPQIVLGPRSSLFLPLAHLGLIVIDESHESSYKQEQNPRYWAWIVAGRLAQLTKSTLILGSATPSLQEAYMVERGKLSCIKLTTRANNQTMPTATIVDLRDRTNLQQSRIISTPLLELLDTTLQNQRQSLLFINRRGSASSQLCSDCGYVSLCPSCEIPLTFHADTIRLICHYCNYQAAPPAVCPSCNGMNLRFIGIGTKRVEAEVARLFPDARIARLDKDSANLEDLHRIYEELQTGKLDILIGTQMIAKGLDLPQMDTVGIILADTMLHLPDYSASERTFQLISQVSGRSGRGDRAGQVLIQSYTPDHPAITFAAQGNYWGFVEHELATRRALSYPPYVYLLKLSCSFTSQSQAIAESERLAKVLGQTPAIQVMGPAPAFHEVMRGKYHWQLIIKSTLRSRLVDIAKAVPHIWTTDLDPVNLL